MSNVELVKSQTDIVELISSYVQLNKAGSNYKGLCPFHNEKSPSFMVNPSLQIYKCFGCGKGGDTLNFVQEIERFDFPEALKFLAERAGIVLEDNFTKTDDKVEKEKQKIYEANMLTAKFYQYLLKTHKVGEEARKYAQKRGLTAKEIDKFMFGYAPKSKTNLKTFLEKKGFDPKDLERWSLLSLRDKDLIDKFRDRLMQPIFDLKGNIVGFSGRYLGTFEGAPKYLNSSETLVYKKQDILFSLYQSKEAIRKQGVAILVEGNIDPVTSHRVGVENIVAPLGTAFTDAQARLIKKFADSVIFAFDNDSAGLSATIRALSIAENIGLSHKVIDVSPFQDVDEMIMQDPKQWESKLKEPIETIDFLISKFESELDLGTVTGKSKFHSQMLGILKLLKDEIQISHYVKKISMKLGIDESVMLEEVQTGQKTTSFGAESPAQERVEAKKETDLELYFLALIIQNNIPIKKSYLKLVSADQRKHILNLIREEKESDIFSDQSLEQIYSEASLIDLSYVDSIPKEIERVITRLEKRALQSEMLNIRREMDLREDDSELLEKLSKLTSKLNSLSQKN